MSARLPHRVIARAGRALALVALAALAGPGPVACTTDALPPTGQLVVYVTTDAPLPAAPGELLLPSEPRALFDRLRIEVTKPGETAPCDGCTRDFEIDRTTIDAGRASIGIVPRPNTAGYRARVRMFTALWARSGVPNADSTIDVTVALPAVAAEGITEVTVMLRTEDVAKAIGQDTPVAASAGRPPSKVVGTWSGAQRIPCVDAAAAGEVCVPGGAFWMGQTPEYELPARSQLSQQRIAVVSPYFLQTTEVTVAAFRASKLAAAGDPDTTCEVYTASKGPNELQPVNCVSWNKARQYCARSGGDLPTEAQFEYAAGATASRKYVWGDDVPTCADAVYGHTFALGATVVTGACNLQGGPRAVGSGLRDRLLLPGAAEEIVDLAGNLSEWTLDYWNDEHGPCWGTGVFTDPFCATPDPKAPARTVRGGSVLEGPLELRAARRSKSPDKYTSIGFRCARPDAP